MSTHSVIEALASIAPAARAIAHRTRGSTHGPVTRLMSPGDLGKVLKPFIFLDLVNFDARQGQTRFVLGSAVPHPHPLVMGSFSVHTSADALARGEAEIRRIGFGLRDPGQLG
jgi:hypothetical protein